MKAASNSSIITPFAFRSPTTVSTVEFRNLVSKFNLMFVVSTCISSSTTITGGGGGDANVGVDIAPISGGADGDANGGGEISPTDGGAGGDANGGKDVAPTCGSVVVSGGVGGVRRIVISVLCLVGGGDTGAANDIVFVFDAVVMCVFASVVLAAIVAAGVAMLLLG